MKLSIIVPVYNVEKYLAKCLASLVEPDLNDYEIIAVNDGSTDRSRDILGEWCAEWPTLIKPVDTPNGGLGHARNIGISVAKGEYLLFVDSDDYLKPHAVKEILQKLEEPFDIAVFDFVHVDEQGRELASFSGCEQAGPFTLMDYPEFLFSPLNSCNKIWRRSLFPDNGITFPTHLWFEDLASSPKLYLHADRIIHVAKSWYCYLQRKGSITNSTSAERNREMITAFHSVLDYYRAQDCFERFRPQLEYMGFYHEFLTSVTRVNLIDPKSSVQNELRQDYLKSFPEYAKNPYFRNAPAKYRLLAALIQNRQWRAVHLLMKANNKVKGR